MPKELEGIAGVESIKGQAASIADRFLAARRQAEGLDTYPGMFPASLEEAYRVQDTAISRWPKPVRGWKVGRVGAPHDERFGTDRLAGPIFRVVEDGCSGNMAALRCCYGPRPRRSCRWTG